MTQYKLSYRVAIGNNERVEKIANSEIELAEAILDMERDVGAFCHGVTIEQGHFDDNRRSNYKQALQNIKHYAKVLDTAIHIR